MADVTFLDQLTQLTPSAALSIVIVITGVTINVVLAPLLLCGHFVRLTPSRRHDLTKLLEVLASALRRHH